MAQGLEHAGSPPAPGGAPWVGDRPQAGWLPLPEIPLAGGALVLTKARLYAAL